MVVLSLAYSRAFKFKMCLTKTMTELNGDKKNFSHVMHTHSLMRIKRASFHCFLSSMHVAWWHASHAPLMLLSSSSSSLYNVHMLVATRCTRKIYAHFIDRMEIFNMSHNLCVCLFACMCTFACTAQHTILFISSNGKTVGFIRIGNGKVVYCTRWAWLS